MLNRTHATPLPMPDDVIDQVHSIARRQEANPGLVFGDRNQVADTQDDDDVDDSSYQPSIDGQDYDDGDDDHGPDEDDDDDSSYQPSAGSSDSGDEWYDHDDDGQEADDDESNGRQPEVNADDVFFID